jgi:hypothetical protein
MKYAGGGYREPGQAYTDKLHVVERYRLRNADRMQVSFTIEDPGAFTTPWFGSGYLLRVNPVTAGEFKGINDVSLRSGAIL